MISFNTAVDAMCRESGPWPLVLALADDMPARGLAPAPRQTFQADVLDPESLNNLDLEQLR